MNRKTVSELLFEKYLVEHKLGLPDYEPAFPGATKRVDYRLHFNGRNLWFEVKEFAEDLSVVTGEGGIFDPYKAIRMKIDQARSKFSRYKGQCCSLVLFNEHVNLVNITKPMMVLGAMLGDLGIRFPGEKCDCIESIFTTGGKMIDPRARSPRHTRISALIALERLDVGQKEFQIMIERRQRLDRREMSIDEFWDVFEQSRDLRERRPLRAIVYENPYADIPLPQGIFVGPYDERWGRVGAQIAPKFVGPELRKLKEAEHELELDVGALQKHINNQMRGN